jgi:hypothetical protein
MKATRVIATSEYIARAMKYDAMLTVAEFAKVVEYPINMIYVDKFWNTIEEDKLIYVDDELISWMGYTGAEAKTRKIHFADNAQNCIGYNKYNNEEYVNYVKSLGYGIPYLEIYPSIPTGRGSSNIKHILLTPDCLRSLMMQAKTTKGNIIREYYISLEKLFKLYIKYQSKYDDRKSAKQLLDAQTKTAEQERLLEQYRRETEAKNAEIAEKERQIANTRIVTEQLLSYKLFLSRSEILYIITSKLYAQQGLFKVGKTKSLSAKERVGNLNTGHVPGDDLFVAAEFKTNDSSRLEGRAHDLMQHHRVMNTREWFHLPYSAIYKIITMINDHYHDEQATINEITTILHNISCTDPAQIKWDEGVPLMIKSAETVPVTAESTPAEPLPKQAQVPQTPSN